MKEAILTVKFDEGQEPCVCPICQFLGINLDNVAVGEADIRELTDEESEAIRKFDETGDESFLRRKDDS